MGYVLPWGQMSFWGATVITGLFGAIPGVGEPIQTWLLGGPAVDNATLNRFFSLHYLLPFVIAALVAVHIWAFHTTGNNNPTGCRSAPWQQGRGRARHPAVLALLRDQGPLRPGRDPGGVLRRGRLHAELPGPPRQLYRGEPAGDAGAYRAGMVLPAVLRHPARLHRRCLGGDRANWLSFGIIDAKFFGVLAMFGAIAVMALVPWLDTSSVRSGRYRPMFKWWFALLCIDFVVLMWCGAMPAREPYATISLIASAYWFAYFLIILPLLGVIEKPLAAACDHRGRLQRPLRPQSPSGRVRGNQHVPQDRTHRRIGSGPPVARRPETAAKHIEDVAFAHEGPFGKFDQFQLQRGLQVYTEVCSGCHGLKFVPIRTLSDAGGPGTAGRPGPRLCQAVHRDRQGNRRRPRRPADRQLPGQHRRGGPPTCR
jgi:hypothetical protein